MHAEVDSPVDDTLVWHRPPFMKSAAIALAVLAFGVLLIVLRQATAMPLGFTDPGFSPTFFFGGLALSCAEALAVAASVLLSFWLIFPVVGYLRLGELVARALIASMVVTAMTWIVGFLGQWAVYGSEYFASVSPWDYFLATGFQNIPNILASLPLVFLAALALREWDRRAHDVPELENTGAIHGKA